MSEFLDMNLQWRTMEVSDAHVSERIAMGIVCHGRRVVSQLSLEQNHGRADCNNKANRQNKTSSLLPDGYAHLPKGEVQTKTSI